jgi:hypothetical protein
MPMFMSVPVAIASGLAGPSIRSPAGERIGGQVQDQILEGLFGLVVATDVVLHVDAANVVP